MYYNQNDYKNEPYPSGGNPNATIKSGGCGVCCGSTILSLFGNDSYPPPTLAKIFRQKGARVSAGTDMKKAANIICELGNLTYTTSSSETELVLHLRNGGFAIANVDGNAGELGIFSNEGHYICVVGVRDNGLLEIFDVGDYPTKFNSAYRASKVKRDGKLLLCTIDTLNIDTKHRTPNYYLFTKVEEEMSYEKYKEYKAKHDLEIASKNPSTWSKEARDWAIENGIIKGDGKGNYSWCLNTSLEQVIQVIYNIYQSKV